MKVLRIANGIYPETVGGVEVSVAKLSRKQVEDGHDVSVLLPEPTSRDGETPEFCSVEHYDPKARLFGNPLSTYPYNYVKARLQDIDVVHAHSHLYSGSVFAARACNKYDVPFVVTSHGFESQTAPMYVNVPYNETVGRYVFRSADEILTYTDTEVQKLQSIGIDKEKIHHITRGIDIGSCVPNHELSTDPANILWVSRFVPGKGAHIVVEAIDDLRERGVDVEATLVGEGPDRGDVEEQISDRGLEPYVTIKDFMPQEELYHEYADATLFVLPSVSEGMNRTILEAMASGTPAVISDLPHFYDVVDGCGCVVNELDGSAFADGIEEVLRDDVEELSRNARERVEGHYTWDNTFEEISPVFQKVVEQQ